MATVSWAITDINDNTKNNFPNYFLLGESVLKIKATVTGLASGVTIREPWISINGTWQEGSEVKISGYSVMDYNSIKLEYWGKDSKGNIVKSSTTTQLHPYMSPFIDTLSIRQTDSNGTPNETGTHMEITVKGKVDSLGNRNTKTLTIYYKPLSADENSYTKKVITPENWSFTEVIRVPAPHDIAYNVRAVISDKLHTYIAVEGNGIPTISRLAGGDGVTLFADAKKPGFWIKNIDYTITDERMKNLCAQMQGNVVSSLAALFDHVIARLGEDRIIEKGTAGVWYYEKWSSGKSYCRRTHSSTENRATWSSWGSLYYKKMSGFSSYVNGLFKATPALTVSTTSQEGSLWATWTSGDKTGLGNIYLISPSNSSGNIYCILTIEAKGWWK